MGRNTQTKSQRSMHSPFSSNRVEGVFDSDGDLLPAIGGLSAVKTKASVLKRLQELQSSEDSGCFSVSPSTPLLTTHISENSYVCGERGLARCGGDLNSSADRHDLLPGSNRAGQLGIAGASQLAEPQLIQGAGNKWASIAFGGRHAAGLACSGHLFTWGTNSKGQLGQGALSSVISVPTRLEIKDGVTAK